MSSSTLAIFDSGLGGLSVLKSLALHFKKTHFIYLGDTARLPYGTKSPETIRRYFEQNKNFLKMQSPIEGLIVACNTASTVLTPADHENESEIPIFEVIQPGALSAHQRSKTRSIGVIGTNATIEKKAYSTQLLSLDPTLHIIEKATPLLVPLVEEGFVTGPITLQILDHYLHEFKNKQNMDTLILGCTHYPLLKEALNLYFNNKVQLIDSTDLLPQFIKEKIGTKIDIENDQPQNIKLLLTDQNSRYEGFIKKILSPLNLNSIESVSL